MRRFSLVVILLLELVTLPCAAEEMEPRYKVQHGVPPFVILEILSKGNAAAVAGAEVDVLPADPVLLTWLLDCDAAVQPHRILPDPQGKAYVVRNFGAQLSLAKAAVDYGIRELFSPVLLITGQTRSETVRLCRGGAEQMAPSIREALDRLCPPVLAAEPPSGLDEQWRLDSERVVDQQVDEALAIYGDRVNSGRLTIMGSIYDLHNLYGRGAGRLLIININGERDDDALRRLPVAARLDDDQRRVVLGRAVIKPIEEEKGLDASEMEEKAEETGK